MKQRLAVLVLGVLAAIGGTVFFAGAQGPPRDPEAPATVTRKSAVGRRTEGAERRAREEQARRAKAPAKRADKSEAAKREKAAAAAPVRPKANRPQRVDPRPGRGRAARGGLPERYASIIDQNLFRKLGWGGEAKRDPFQLVGVMVAGDVRRALLGHNSSAVYAEVGNEVGEGYTVASIERGAVELTGGEQGKLSLALDTGVVAAKGGGPPKAAKARGPEKREKKDGRWRPPKGTPGNRQFEMILEREGLTWEDVKRNPQLAGEVKESYSYVWEDDK